MFAENVDAFFDLSAFGEAATITVGGTPASVVVIFDNAYVDPLGSFESRAPTAWLTLADAPSVAQGDTLAVRGTTYTIVEVMPDGTGAGGIVQLRMRS